MVASLVTRFCSPAFQEWHGYDSLTFRSAETPGGDPGSEELYTQLLRTFMEELAFSSALRRNPQRQGLVPCGANLGHVGLRTVPARRGRNLLPRPL